MLFILLFSCDANSTTYQEGIQQRSIEDTVGAEQLFETKGKVEKTPDCVLKPRVHL